MKNIFKRATALLLSLLMVFSVCSTSLIIYATTPEEDARVEDKVINYVSLGDSMTNGYGLDGYNHNSGVEDYGTLAYPNQFEAWLDLCNGEATVDHAKLAMSGIRTEDIHWLLEFDYTNANLIKVVDEFVAENNNDDEVWDQDKWEQNFDCGDYWTVNEICNHSRTNATYAHIAGGVYEAYEGCTDHGMVDNSFFSDIPDVKEGTVTMGEKVAVIAKYYQKKVAAADIISLSVGNGNIGVFGFGRILETIGFADTTTYLNYNYEDVLRECDEDMQKRLMAMIEEIKPALTGMFPDNDKLIDVAVYIAVSLTMNYAGTVDAILQMNPDVEIILMPVMNTFGDPKDGFEAGSLGAMMEFVVEPINKFIAALPTYMQVTNHGVYKDAKFYYAEPEYVECMVATYEYPLSKTPIIRDRFVESIVGYCNCGANHDAAGNDPSLCQKWKNGMIWDMLASMKLVRITLSEIEAYEALGNNLITEGMTKEEQIATKDAAKLAYAATASDKAMAISMYLAFEKAIVEGKDNSVMMDSIFGLGEVLGGGGFDTIMENFYAQTEVDGAAKLDTVVTFVAAASGGQLTEEQVRILLGDEDVIKSYVWAKYKEALLGNHTEEHHTIEGVLACQIEDCGYYCQDARDLYDALKTDYAKYLFTAQVAATINSMMGDPAVIEILHKGYLADKAIDDAAEEGAEPSTANWTAAVYEAVAVIANNLYGAGLTKDDVENLHKADDRYQVIYAIIATKAGTTPETVASLITNWDTFKDYATAEQKALYSGYEMLSSNLSTICGGVDLINANKEAITGGADSMFAIADTVDLLCTLLVVPDTLADVLGKSDMAGLLALFARCYIGNGIGAHPSKAGHDNLAAAVIAAYFGFKTAEDKTDENIDFKEFPVVKSIISKLTAKGYLNDDQILEIAFCAYKYAKDGDVDDGDIFAIVLNVYDIIMLENGLSAEQKIDIIFTVCDELNYGALDDFVNIAKKLVAKDENGYQQVTELQAFAIVHIVYLAYANDAKIDDTEFRVIANIIYFVILGKPHKAKGPSGIDWDSFTVDSFMTGELGGDFEKLLAAVQQDSEVIAAKDPAQKVAIIKTVVDAVPEEMKDSNPQVNAVTTLVTTLTQKDENNESLLSDEQLATVIDSAFENFVEIKEEPITTEQAISNITQTLVEELVGMEPEKFDKVMDAITGTLEDLNKPEGGEGTGSIVIPEITIPEEVKIANELMYELEQEGLLTAEQRGALVSAVVPVLTSGVAEPMDLVDTLYGIFYNEGFDAEKTVKLVIFVVTFAYEKGLIYTYGNPYYAEAMAKVLTEENVDAAKVAVDAAIKAIEQAIEYLSKSARGGIETDTTALKAALIAELNATLDTLNDIKLVLDNADSLNTIKTDYEKAIALIIATFEDDLWAHIDNISDIVLKAGLIADPYILAAIDAVNSYAQIVDQRVQDAYAWVVNGVVEFNADYLALVEKIGAEVDKIDPVLGEAVRKFMIEAPADTLYILYVYGEDAVNELIDRALVYGDAVATAAIELARVLNKHGVTIYNAIMNSDDCKALYAELLGVVDQILALEEQIKKPSDIEDIALDIYGKLDKLQAYAIDLAGRFYDAAIAAVKADDYLAGEELCNAINALVAALATIDDEAIDYAEWLGEHATEMGGALLTAFLANWNEFAEVSGPIIYREALEIYNQVKDYILNYDYDALIQQIIDAAVKFAPELDAMLYDYFYNNPEEVIAFFEEYGPEIVDLSVKYGPYALGVIGVALAAYGPELADYIINNPEAVLAGLTAWADKYGDRVVAILQVYAEALGICDAVRAEMAALQAQLDALNEQLKTAVGEAREQILAEIAIVQAKLAELNAKLMKLTDAINKLNEALKYFVNDIFGGYTLVIDALNNLDAAIRDLMDSVSEDLADRLAALMHNSIELTKDMIKDLAELAVESLIKFAPELDEMLYNYFYNNPEEVIAFFNEYGDEIVELCKEYGDEALGVIAIALAYFGPELAEYIINNPDDALAGIIEWADKYGERIVAILQVYAEALGLCDQVRDEIAVLNAKLAALQAELEKQYALLQNAVGAEVQKIAEYISQLQAMIAEIQAKIEALNAKLQALVAALYDLNDALKALVNDVQNGIEAVQQAMNKAAVAVRNLLAVLSDDIAGRIDALLQQAKDFLNGEYADATIGDYTIDKDSLYVALGDNKAYADLFAQYLKDAVKAEGVGYNYKVNTALVQDGSKINTLPVIVNNNIAIIAAADLISIGYSYDTIAEETLDIFLDLLLNGTTTVDTAVNWAGLLGADIAQEVLKVLDKVEAELNAKGLDIAIGEAYPNPLFNSTVTISEAAMTALEYFAYYAVEYAVLMPQAVNVISQINSEALILINAISNPIAGAGISFAGLDFAFGDYLNYVTDIILVETAAVAVMYENAVIVPTTEATTTFTNVVISEENINEFLALILMDEIIPIDPTEAGNVYVCQKMAEALNITVVNGGLLGDVNGDGSVDYVDAILILRHEVGFVDPKFVAGVADVDGDGYIGYVDAIWVLRYEIGLETEFPAAK